MTKREACDRFWNDVMPFVADAYEQDGRADGTARREAWNDWLDGLQKDGELSSRQLDRLGGIPDRLERKRYRAEPLCLCA